MTLSNKTALVTGASSGIGAAYADQLASRGYHLILVARREERLQQLALELKQKYAKNVEVIVADLASPVELEWICNCIRDVDQLDMLVNCAGLGALGTSQQVNPQSVVQMLLVNVIALTQLSLAAAKRFSQQQSGNIINIGSILAAMPVAGAGAYSGSKAYVLNFSKALQAEFKTSSVKVQVIMPGPVKTEFFTHTPAPFPESLFMQPETLVETALIALDQGEDVIFPNLEDMSLWEKYEISRGILVKGLTQSNAIPSRYL
ncbi:MAG: SDR family oxidoreductase [Moraxellaceae bacterium]|uniref:NADP-dependent 3-hydroxy acid dehydrogenase YdfG n=1 Tax=Acinetobacter tjernbergiae DSM 14971 = CIP 107465 TaxID=1120928 RepID=V2UXQ9_9GAMM|nr:SDR family oxidoreductase [Acinetobacter tjernbergiae]ESK53445.1 hypothetical protein F990_03351 [Acinetobacter tjernbergiae DSM 14971 = CIP 107465]MBH2002757.1 SDR family oxidoreductase [Moraxellaceae bacterium]MBH2030179.1 SDR family oxidoreductase [Moraxellaceae bacterium]